MTGSDLSRPLLTAERPRTARAAGALADLVAVVHVGVSAFILVGAVLVLAGWVPAWVHLPVAAWGVIVFGAELGCPLTTLEQRLRRRAGESAYEGGFVERYLLPRRMRGRVGRGGNRVIAAIVLAVNLALYGALLAR